MGKPSPPTPPDPQDTAAAQTGTNVGTSVANTLMGQVNQNTPFGSLSYEQTGTHSYTDPYTGQTYDIPTFTANTQLSDAQQGLLNHQQDTQTTLAETAGQQANFLQNYLQQEMDPSSLPDRIPVGDIAQPQYGAFQGNANLDMTAASGGAPLSRGVSGGAVMSSMGAHLPTQRHVANAGNILNRFGNVGGVSRNFSDAGPVNRNIADAGAVTSSYGTGDFSRDRQRIEDQMFNRIRGESDREREALRSRLANQGLSPGTEAYNREMLEFDRRVNDSRYGAMMHGGQEQARMTGLAANRAAFENAAQAQRYGQNANNAGFANAAQAQAYNQALGRGQFANQAQNQAFGQASARGQFANQAQAQRYHQNANNQAAFNAAQGQQFGQNLSRTNLFNQAQQQRFGQGMANAQLNNAAQGQTWQQQFANLAQTNAMRQQALENANRATSGNNANASQSYANQMQAMSAADRQRAAALQEMFGMRNQPINEITALLSGSQVNAPNFGISQPQPIPHTDTAGLINDHYGQQMQNWHVQNAQTQSLLGGLFGLGGSLMMGF